MTVVKTVDKMKTVQFQKIDRTNEFNVFYSQYWERLNASIASAMDSAPFLLWAWDMLPADLSGLGCNDSWAGIGQHSAVVWKDIFFSSKFGLHISRGGGLGVYQDFAWICAHWHHRESTGALTPSREHIRTGGVGVRKGWEGQRLTAASDGAFSL
jgi:hypothetical protein